MAPRRVRLPQRKGLRVHPVLHPQLLGVPVHLGQCTVAGQGIQGGGRVPEVLHYVGMLLVLCAVQRAWVDR